MRLGYRRGQRFTVRSKSHSERSDIDNPIVKCCNAIFSQQEHATRLCIASYMLIVSLNVLIHRPYIVSVMLPSSHGET